MWGDYFFVRTFHFENTEYWTGSEYILNFSYTYSPPTIK